jgi:hypothetical protein
MLVMSKELKYRWLLNHYDNPKKLGRIGYWVGDDYISFIRKTLRPYRITTNYIFSSAIHDMIRSGMLQEISGGTSILFVDDVDVPFMVVRNLSDALEQYLEWTGGVLAWCKKCGQEMFQKNNRHTFCSLCYKERETSRKNELKKKRYAQ